MPRLNKAAVALGAACVLAGVVGGGVSLEGIELPAVSSGRRQIALVAIGVIVLVGSFIVAERPRVYFAGIGVVGPYWVESVRHGTKHTYPWDRPTERMFQLTKWFADADPIFDLTLVNTTRSLVVLTDIGMEIDAVAHDWVGMPAGELAQAEKIVKQDALKLDVPNVWGRVVEKMFPDLDVWVDLREVVSTKLPDPVALLTNAPYRCTLMMSGYHRGMPNHVILRMWARTEGGDVRSAKLLVRWNVLGDEGLR